MIKRAVFILLLLSLFVPQRTHAQTATPTPDFSSLAAVVFSGDESAPPMFGVYLGHGLILTNWHPWTLDGQYYTDDESPLSPSWQVPRFDDDGIADPGEMFMDVADCSGTWIGLSRGGSDCYPFAGIAGAGFIFPMAGDTAESLPVRAEWLVYASRKYDIALVQVDALAVESRGVHPARLSMIPTGAEHPVLIPYQLPDQAPAVVESTLQTGEPVLLPEADSFSLDGPWRVPSLVMDTPETLPHGGPVFNQETGDLVGLTWRAGEESGQAWITPAAVWFHELYAANDDMKNEALAAVLAGAAVAPVDGPLSSGDPLAANLGNGGIDVEHYSLKLDFDLEAGSLAGVVSLDIRATYDQLFTFSLDAYHLEIDSVTVDGAEVPFLAKEEKLIIELPAALPYGTAFQVAVVYHATPEPYYSPYVPYFGIGMVFQENAVYTLHEPDGAHTWFPCNDHPGDRATYDFYLRVDDPLEVIANGTLNEVVNNDDGTRTFYWQMPDPMATYLALVAIGDYTVVEDQTQDGIPLYHYVYPGQVEVGTELFSYTDDALSMLENWFGPYPYDSYGHVVAAQDAMAMETQSMTIMPDAVLDWDEEAVYGLMVHELAHQWFGDTVTPGSWNDIWLNEGFATYIEWLAQEARFGEQAAIATRSTSEQTLFTDQRITPLIAPLPAEMLGTASYDKGAWVLYMLHQQIGDEAFFTLMQTYLDTYRNHPADSLGFWQLAESVSGLQLAWFFDQWLLQPGGIPVYSLYWTERSTGADVLLCPMSEGEYKLDLPLTFSNGRDVYHGVLTVDGREARVSFDLGFEPSALTVDPDQMVLARVTKRPIAELPESCPVGE